MTGHILGDLTKWDRRWINVARERAAWSKDPSTKVGAVIVSEARRVDVSKGYNGFPRGIDDSPALYLDRARKYERVVHAEANAIVLAGRDLRGHTIYIWPLFTCAGCAKLIIQAGISRVVGALPVNARWQADYDLALDFYRQAGVEVVLYDPSEFNT